jgi:hypothetical protein
MGFLKLVVLLGHVFLRDKDRDMDPGIIIHGLCLFLEFEKNERCIVTLPP